MIDADSSDSTVERIEAVRDDLGVPLRLTVADERLPIGESRNLAVRMAEAPNVAFLSADTELHERWTEEALASLEDADMVFSRQVHDPGDWTLAACVRGLRYHFPEGEAEDPLVYASNAAAAYRKEVLEEYPFDPDVVAVDDLLLAARATAGGYEADYNPELIVYHHDVDDVGGELSKSIREARGWGLNVLELGPMRPVIAWGVVLLAALSLLLTPSSLVPTSTPLDLALLVGVLWAPALRRSVNRAGRMPAPALLAGFLASPVFDLVFLFNYARGLLERTRSDGSRPTAEAEGIER